MKERPILFNDEMVRALLAGRKTQTRRLVKPQPSNGWSFETADGAAIRLGFITSSHPKKGQFGAFIRREIHPGSGKYERDIITCPYGQPGDLLWVRESTEEDCVGSASISRYCADGAPVLYSGCDDPEFNGSWAHWDYPRLKRPSIHMPRWACRLLLEITTVRVERLLDITEADAQAEGVDGEAEAAAAGLPWHDNPRRAFRFLWKRINGPDSWDANPWVWVVEFKRIDDAREVA